MRNDDNGSYISLIICIESIQDKCNIAQNIPRSPGCFTAFNQLLPPYSIPAPLTRVFHHVSTPNLVVQWSSTRHQQSILENGSSVVCPPRPPTVLLKEPCTSVRRYPDIIGRQRIEASHQHHHVSDTVSACINRIQRMAVPAKPRSD